MIVLLGLIEKDPMELSWNLSKNLENHDTRHIWNIRNMK